jgi:hypothetical protein
MASGSTVLVRQGSPFEVTVSEPEHWKVQWSAPGIEQTGSEFRWSPAQETPTQNASTLTVHCRSAATGNQRFIAWLWPTRELKLHGVNAQSTGTYRQKIKPPPGGVWIYPHTRTNLSVEWDERALALLTVPLLQALKGTLPLSVPVATASRQVDTAPTPDKPLWWLVHSFKSINRDVTRDVTATAPGAAPDEPQDAGTYALLNSNNPESDLPRVARLMAGASPKANIKLGIRLDAKPPRGVLRLVMDDTGARGGWVKNPGQPETTPLRWWDKEGEISAAAP